MLPNFLIIGAQKAATSWLAMCLGGHPDVFMVREKEIHFFNREYERGLVWYESHFSDWAGQTAIGEATPGYISYRATPARIKTILGDDVRLIASLRHPVDRAYSAFWHHVRLGNIRAGTDFRTFFRADNHLGVKSRGYYFAYLNGYLQNFRRENLLVITYDEVVRDGQKVVHDCLEFLELDAQYTPAVLESKVNRGIAVSAFQRQVSAVRGMLKSLPQVIERPLMSMGRHVLARMPQQKSYESLTDDLRQELLGEYMSDIKQLEDLVDMDLSIWYETT